MSVDCREIVDQVKSETCHDCIQLQKEFEKNPGGLPARRGGLIVAAIAGGAALALSSICVPFVTPALRRYCLPYVPATTQQVQNVMQGLKGRKGKLIDIGSGDGRIVFEAARAGFQSHGVELNFWLVLFSKFKSLRLGMRKTATFSRQDLWKTNFETYPNVVIFGVEQMMPALEEKLTSELSPDSRVVACRFQFPSWTPEREIGEGVDTVWVYQPKKRN